MDFFGKFFVEKSIGRLMNFCKKLKNFSDVRSRKIFHFYEIWKNFCHENLTFCPVRNLTPKIVFQF
jgi:hypothetical protein